MNSNGLAGCTILELGPGDSIATGLIAHAYGVGRTYLIDVGSFVYQDIQTYHKILDAWKERGISCDNLEKCHSFEDLCNKSNTLYLTDGIKSLKTIPTGSVDFVFSNAVLEHVRHSEFMMTMAELRRVLKPAGVGSHLVDLKDHLGGALNNLRFSERIWESSLFASSGFYTNRIRFGEMLQYFKKSGFRVKVIQKKTWTSLPTPREKMWHRYRRLPDEDLLVSGFKVVH